jgi:cell division transport system permease protein
MLDRIEFLVTEAFTSLRRNTWMTFSAVTTSATALMLLGGLGLIYMSILDFAQSLPSKLEMRAIMKMDLPDEQVEEVGRRIREIPQVAGVELVPREEAWEKARQSFPAETEGMENVLPDAYKVTMRDVGQADEIADAIEKIPGQDGVEYFREEYNLIDQTVRLIRLIGAALGGMMLLTSGVLIYNSIRLAIVARSKEIRIMQLVGAARSTIWIPLLIEGFVQGALGGVLAATVLWPAYNTVQSMSESLAFLGDSKSNYPALLAYSYLVGIGAFYGLLCSMIAVRERRQRVR